MTVQNVSSGMPAPLGAESARFFLPGASDFAGGLRLGEVIKGKVLRQYDGNRYQVNFNGHERVVDSSMPLSTGELIHGRVVAIGERVELQRVYSSDGRPEPAPTQTDVQVADAQIWRRDRRPEELLAHYNVRLNEADIQIFKNALRGAHDGNAMALVGAMLNKLGLQQAPELLWPVYHTLMRRDAGDQAVPAADAAAVIDNLPWQPASVPPVVMRQLAEAIDRVIAHNADEDDAASAQTTDTNPALSAMAPVSLPAPKPVSDEDTGQSSSQEQLAYWLLNAQVDGTVAHRVGTLPLLLGDRLIEVEMSFFEQRRDAEQKPEAKHRKIMFSLKLENLGRVEVMARLAGEHASVSVVTDDQDRTAEVARYAEQLKLLLARLGWTVDQVAYETRQADRYNGVVRAVVEHVVNHDSLDRLV